MSLDGIVTSAIINEINEKLVGGRIDKIHQPDKDDLIFSIYSNGNNYKLLVSINSSSPRVYLTLKRRENPDVPPSFVMLLRKYLTGGIISKVTQQGLDRCLSIVVSSLNEFGELSDKEIIIELMGKHSNVILIDSNTRRIYDSLKRVNIDISRLRQVLPGLIYEPSPTANKINIKYLTEKHLNELIELAKPTVPIYKFLYSNLEGFSPLLSKDIVLRIGLDEDQTILGLNDINKKELYKNISDVYDLISSKSYSPVIYNDPKTNSVLDFYIRGLLKYPDSWAVKYDSVSEMLEDSYITKDTVDRISQKANDLKKSLNHKLERSLNKLAKQKDELLDSEKREKFKVYADLLQANLYRVEKGASSVELENFYATDMKKLLIPLDKRYSASENAQRYYKKYSKLKNAAKALVDLIKETEMEISYLEHALVSLDNSTTILELEEIREDLVAEGLLTRAPRKGFKKLKAVNSPLEFKSSDGFVILVGKNNKQNDQLTMKIARKNDIWLHTKNIPGSHVIIRSEGVDIPPTTIHEAANIAAYYSKARLSSNVEVDYTFKKNVRKPNGAKTGFVIYDTFNSISVNPSKSKVQDLHSDTIKAK